MRARSLTIYAENAEDYQKIMNSQDEMNNKKRCNIAKQEEYSHQYYESNLSHNKEFELTFHYPSYQEKLDNEENQLMERISQVRNHFKDQNFTDPNEFLNLFKNNFPNFSNEIFSENNSQLNTNTTSLSSENQNMINQNFDISDEVLKIIFIGNRGVGKTFVKNKISNISCENNYISTQTLEINKFAYLVKNKKTTLEFWDTNVQILNSPILKTYLKICHSFILICDENNFSVDFLEKQINNIINFSNVPDNFILIVNRKNRKNLNCNKYCESSQNFDRCLTTFIEKYNITSNKIIYFNSDINDEFKIKFDIFINNVLATKKRKSFPSKKDSMNSIEVTKINICNLDDY